MSVATPKGRGRPRRPDSYYRGIALSYLELLRLRHPRPRQRLAQLTGVSDSKMRSAIARCRRYGFLSPARHGVPGATAGPNLALKK